MTPIFSRSWLMKITEVRERLIAPASLRSAWLISRARRPRGRPALALGVRDHVQCQRGLTARFGAEDLRYPPPRDAADPDRRVQVDRARRDDLHPHPRRIGPHPHDGALAASLLDLRDGEVEGLSALVRELRDF